MNPLENITSTISARDFELFCVDLLVKSTDNNHHIEHDITFETPDGNYQIDIFMRHKNPFGIEYKTLVECKRHSSPIKREVVQLLYDKIRACGANKGIVMSTSGFQDGAIKFAQVHSIALIQFVDRDILNITNSNSKPKMRLVTNISQPKYVPIMYDIERGFYLSTTLSGCIHSLSDYLRR